MLKSFHDLRKKKQFPTFEEYLLARIWFGATIVVALVFGIIIAVEDGPKAGLFIGFEIFIFLHIIGVCISSLLVRQKK